MQKTLILLPIILLAAGAGYLFLENQEQTKLSTSYADFSKACNSAYSGKENNPVICINAPNPIYTMTKTSGTTRSVSLDPYIIAFKEANPKPLAYGTSIYKILTNALSWCEGREEFGELEGLVHCVSQNVYNQMGENGPEFSVTATKYNAYNSYIFRGLNLYSNYSGKRNHKGWDVYLNFY